MPADQHRTGDVIQSKAQSTRPSSPRLRLVPERGGRPIEERPAKDVDLVRALRAGDPEAPAALWARYSPSVGRVLAKALGPTLDIEDLTQEVFLRVFGRLPSLRDPSALRAFVLAVAMNVLKWELRRRWIGRRVRLSGTGRLPEIESTSVDAEARHGLQRCYRILDSLARGDGEHVDGPITERRRARHAPTTAMRPAQRGASRGVDHFRSNLELIVR